MKTLLLLRHAKSSHKDTAADDHERPLNKRGKRDAARMGQLLVEQNMLPDFIIASSAKRCRKTAEQVIQSSKYRGEMRLTVTLYEAHREKLLEVLGGLPETIQRPLLIAHNPGMEEFLEAITGEYHPLSTAALAHLELPIDSWSELTAETRATLRRVWQPRELE